MALTVTLDHLGGVEYRDGTGIVRSIIRRGTVQGWWTIAPVAFDQAASLILFSESPDFPYPGQEVDIGNGRKAYLVDRGVRVRDNNTAEVELTYRYLGDPILDPWICDASLRQVTDHRDRLGEPIVVTHNGIPQTVAIPVSVPTLRMTKQYGKKIELGGMTPEQYVRQFLGKVNEGAWRTFEPKTCMVTNMRAVTVVQPNGAMPEPHSILQIDVEIEYKRGAPGLLGEIPGHQPVVRYVEETTGRPGTDLLPGVGYKIIDVYETVPQALWDSEFGV